MTKSRRETPTALLLMLTGAFALGACGGDAGSENADGLAGTLAGPDVALNVTVQDEYSVGALEGEDWQLFTTIDRVAFDGQGWLYILDPESAEITVVDAEGEYVRTIGKRGSGPGEFQYPWGISVFRDGKVAVFDLMARGFILFDEAGNYVENIPVDIEEGAPGQVIHPLADGSMVSYNGMRMRMGPPSEDDVEEEEPLGLPIERFTLDGEPKTQTYLAWEPPPTDEGDTAEMGGEGRQIMIRMDVLRAFEPDLSVAALNDGHLAVIDSVGYRVKIIAPDGSLLTTFERPISPTAVDDGIRTAEKARRMAEAEDEGEGGAIRIIGGANMSVDPTAIRNMMMGRLETMIFASHIPVLSNVAADWENRIWIERTGAELGEDGPTDIVTLDGVYLGTIAAEGTRIPDAFGPNGLVAYIETDEYDVETVRVGRVSIPQN